MQLHFYKICKYELFNFSFQVCVYANLVVSLAELKLKLNLKAKHKHEVVGEG